MANNALIYLMDSVLGKGKSTSKGNRAYFCPECKHHKLKLEVNLDESSSHFQSYNCWTCGFKGKKLTTLFKKIETDQSKIDELRFLVKSSSNEGNRTENVIIKKVTLPKEFTPLINPPINNLTAKHALHYLKTRNITQEDIIKYNIGYCEFGMYANMIIIPSYDHIGNLNYFVSRNFNKNSSIKYKNPDISRDIIGLELFINWNTPITLCEGIFDAIAIKRNAVPLLGKTIQNSLMKKIINSSVQKIYIALDKDAIKQALNFCETLMNEGKEVYLVDINEKDPSDMGFVKFTNLIQNTFPLTFSNLLEKKLQII
jgi:DNA primase